MSSSYRYLYREKARISGFVSTEFDGIEKPHIGAIPVINQMDEPM